jgi:Invasion associated locus B (IalB) protein
LKAGKQMIVRGTSSRGTETTDTYSLSGFTAALAAIDKACGGS